MALIPTVLHLVADPFQQELFPLGLLISIPNNSFSELLLYLINMLLGKRLKEK